ncbi:MAG: glycoside hydrolase family 16 protein [Kiritimatiellia bacterium]|nr:glycoside hydrolase family 16 protein [Kiritimatiellia bacterium]
MRAIPALVPLLLLSTFLSATEWRLVWSEEFNVPGKPDPKVWNFEKGFLRNQEPQYYTDRNAIVRDGCLVITGRREQVPNEAYSPSAPEKDWRKSRKSANYTSSSITTANKKEFFYGRIAVRAKCPKGSGMWPAIWTIGASASRPKDSPEFKGWPASGEIDIMEYAGKNPAETTAAIHCGKDSKPRGAKHISPKSAYLPATPHDGFHIYALEWDSNRLRILYDERLVLEMPLSKADTPDGWNPFRQPHYLLLNLALGTNFGGPIDDSALPAEFLVDYVRYYQKP